MTALRPDLGLLLLRLPLGVVFLFHGAQKMFGAFGGYGIDGTASFMEGLGLAAPTLMTLLVAATELIGGAALLTGIGARLLAAPLTFAMLVASFLAHGGAFAASENGMEFPLTLAFATAAVGLMGPGRYVVPFAAGRALAPRSA